MRPTFRKFQPLKHTVKQLPGTVLAWPNSGPNFEDIASRSSTMVLLEHLAKLLANINRTRALSSLRGVFQAPVYRPLHHKLSGFQVQIFNMRPESLTITKPSFRQESENRFHFPDACVIICDVSSLLKYRCSLCGIPGKLNSHSLVFLPVIRLSMIRMSRMSTADSQ